MGALVRPNQSRTMAGKALPLLLLFLGVASAMINSKIEVLKDYNNQMPVIRSGDADAIINLIDGGMSVNSQCPIPYHQPLLNYLILYGRPANPMGAAKAMQYAMENGADLNKGAQNGVCYSTDAVDHTDYNTVVYPYRCAIAGDFKPVHAAAYMGDLDCLMMLGDAGADLTAPSAEGFTALSAPFLNKNLTVAEIKPVINYLMDNAEFDPSLTDSNGATPLHYAAAWGNKDLVIPFLSKGWNPALKDKTGLSVKDMADVALWNNRGDITILFI